jgi:hypothetical protein
MHAGHAARSKESGRSCRRRTTRARVCRTHRSPLLLTRAARAQVRNSSFTAFIDSFTANTYIMVVLSDPKIQSATTQLNIRAARHHFERFVTHTQTAT